MYCHQDHSTFPNHPQQSEFPTVEAAPKFGGKSISTHMISPAPSALSSYPNAIGGPPSTMSTKEMSAATAADQLFAASNPPCPMSGAGCDIGAASATGWVSPSGHESTADSIFVVSSTHPSAGATVPGSDSLFATTGSAKSRKRPAHVMETAHSIPVLPASPKRPPPSWFNMPPADVSRGMHLQPGPFPQANASPSTFKAPPWIPSTRLSPAAPLKSESRDAHQGPSWDGEPQPHQFVSPSACHAKSPPTSQSPTSTSEGLKLSMNQQPPPTQGGAAETQLPTNERLPPSSNGARAPTSDASASDLLKSPWWSLTNATNEVNPSIWETQQARPTLPPAMMPPSSDRLSKMSVPRLDPFGTIRGASGTAPLRLPGLPSEAPSDRGFEFMLSTAHQTSQLPPLRPPRAPHQGPFPADGIDDRCEVCWDNEETAVNPIIQCKGCGVKVHQQCYGVCRNESEAEWFCALCLYWRTLGVTTHWKPETGESTGAEERPPPLLYCVLCNRPKGAMKTGSEGRWVHVSCVLYSQDGPTFRDVATRSNPINIDKHLVTHNRNRYSCSICRSTEGYTTNCSFPGCLKRVHVACVFANGYRPKLQTITADVPLYPTAFLCQLPGSPPAEPTETRVVEKLVKIITCETHASENAYNAVELYEKKLLKKTDLSVAAPQAPPDSLLPPPLHPSFLPQATGDTTCRPTSGQTVPTADTPAGVSAAQTASILTPHSAAAVAPNRLAPQAAPTQQNMWPAAAAQPMYQQYPPPTSSYRLPNGMFMPSAGYPLAAGSTASPYYMHPWHVTPYGGYHAYRGGYGPQYGNIYPDARTGQPGAYPSPYWPSAAYGSLLNRHHTGFSRVNGGGPRGACGINKSRTLMNRGDDTKTTPTASMLPRKKDMNEARPISGMAPSPSNRRVKASSLRTKAEAPASSTSKVTKPAQSASLGPKQRKAEIGSPRTLDEEGATRKSSVKSQRKKGSARASSTTSGALASTTQRKESKNRGSVSRRKAEEDDDLGTATGHVIGAALSTRGFRINWAKIDPHFRSLRQISDDNLLSSRICEKTDQSLPIKSWSWILDDTTDTSVDGAYEDQSERTLNDLRSIWLDNCSHVPERGPEAPLTVVVSAKVPKTTAEPQTKVCEGAWTFWSMQEEAAKDSGTTTPGGGSDGMSDEAMEAEESQQAQEGQRTPTRQANICEDISSCHLTLSPSPYTKMRRREPSSSDKKRVHLHLMQSYALTAKHIACLRQRQSVSRRDLFTLSARRTSTGESMSDGAENSKMDTSLLSSLRVKGCKSETLGPASATTDFAKVVERVCSGHDDPTGSKQESARSLIEQPKRKVTVDMANWNEIQRIESHLVKRFPVPPFFILLKKLPQDIGRSASSGGPANTQSTTVQKFLAHRDSVSYTLDPAAPRRVVTASKKLYLHGRIWDLNPSFPLCETLFRSRLPEGSINVSLPSFRDQLQNFLSNPNQPPPIPIPDETTREWLASAQKVRLAAGSQAESQLLTEYDRQTAAHGEDLIKILISESYWKRLMFVDDFVRRQALFSFMVWAKKHNRLNTLKDKVSQVLRREVQQCPRIADSDSITEALKRQSDDASRWSAFRGSILAGHQDPGSALVTRVEAEHTGPSSSESADGSANTTGTASKIYFCLVCFGTELDNLNPLVTCARCGIKVHKNCYAIGQPAQLDLDILEWYCDRCETEKKTSVEFRSGTCRCALCLRYGGALRRFQGQSYIHITCAVWSSPLLVCGNLYKLSNWRFSTSHNVSSIAQSRVCIFCVRVQEQQTNRRRATRRRQPRDKVVRVSEDEDDVQATSLDNKYHGGNTTDPFEDTPSPELPLGTRGLPVKCAHEGCTECFHPLCAWLRGLRVIASENYLRSVASAPTDPFLPGVEISAYCESHTPLYSPENRLPLDVISSHRIRAYLTREEEPHFSPPVTLSTGEEVAVPPTTPSDTLDGVHGASHSPRLPPLDHALPEHSSGGSRRPSVNQDLLQGLLASVTDGAQDGDSSVQDDVLAGKDVYSENVCQSCLAPLSSSPESFIKCPECAVRVHTECSAGIFSAPDSVKRKTLHHLCTSCRLGGLAHCALCPRLGGGLCEIPRAVVSLLIGGGKMNSSKSSLTAHKICLMGNVKPEHVNEVKQALSLPESEARSEDDWRQWIILPQAEESQKERKCIICGIGSGCLTSCCEAECPSMMHFSCAGIAGLIRHSTQRCKAIPAKEEEDEPVIKKRRLVEVERYECLCLKHVTRIYLEEEGVNDAVLREHKRIHDLQHKLREIARIAEAVRDRQRKQRELFEQYADNMVGFGLTRLDASYGISYDHTSKITQFLSQFSGQNLVAADEPNAKRATSSSATEAAPDSGSITEGGYLGDAMEGGATESPAAAVMEELTSDVGVPSVNQVPSTSETVDAEAVPDSPPVAAPQPTTTTGMKHTASEVEHARDTLRHTRRRSVDANIDDFPSQQRRVSIAPVDVEKVQDEAVVDVSAIRRHLDAGAADVNHQLVSKESISQTTTASSTSDTGGRRKRKRTIVDAESDDEDEEDMLGGGISQIGTSVSCTPTPQAVLSDSRSKSPKVDFNSDRKRTALPKHPPHPAPPSYRPRSKVPSAAGRNSPYPTQPKRRRVASLPLRNERGQFVRKANQ